ncbi:restriction endonuclease subunit S [Vibrio metschnikovii]|nr:restriction endonuclease subunit S [Vibrio metschnikovii]
MLKNAEWGEFLIGDLFEKIKTKKLPFKADELPKQRMGEYTLPCLTSSFRNQGLNYFVPRADATILKNVISIPSNSDVYRAYFQSNEFTVLSDAYAIKWNLNDIDLSPNQYLFVVQCINKVTDLRIYSYKNKLGGWNVVKNKSIHLPIKDGKIDFDFMESFIEMLEAEQMKKLDSYLSIAGLDNYRLSLEEQNVLDDFENGKIEWGEFNLEKLFGKATRGKRLKSADRIDGSLPFVTAGEAEEGVSAFIGNSLTVFSSNTTTIDMFGSAKYRNYKYGGDDHVAVVHTEKLPKHAAIFVTASIHKSSYTGKFDYGRNFYAKDADELNISLPQKDNKPNYSLMTILLSAIHKLVIKDVIEYVDQKKQ